MSKNEACDAVYGFLSEGLFKQCSNPVSVKILLLEIQSYLNKPNLPIKKCMNADEFALFCSSISQNVDIVAVDNCVNVKLLI